MSGEREGVDVGAHIARTWPENAKPTPEQLADYLAAISREERIERAATILDAMDRADACFLRNHDALLDRLAAAEGARDVLAQAMWDARRELGFDCDGDKHPGATAAGMGYDGYAAMHVREAAEARKDYDDLLDENDAAEQVLAKVRALADEWETAHGDPPVDPSHISVRHAQALRAALDGAPAAGEGDA